MNVIRSKQFVAERAWGALDIARIDDASVRLHWTDQPYHWHVNDGEEVFVVLHGEVEMQYRVHDEEHEVRLLPGDIFHASMGTEHVASPIGEAQILVVERAGSE